MEPDPHQIDTVCRIRIRSRIKQNYGSGSAFTTLFRIIPDKVRLLYPPFELPLGSQLPPASVVTLDAALLLLPNLTHLLYPGLGSRSKDSGSRIRIRV